MPDWRIYERDVDIVLAEEFYANPNFAAWVLNYTRSFADASAEVAEVHVSLSDNSGESDLTVIYQRADGSRFALLIEDKIDAGFQPDQLGRYRKRGNAGVAEARWKSFEVLLFAPGAYIQRTVVAEQFDAAISYEDIANCIRDLLPGPRGKYRAEFLTDAAPRGASAYVKIKDEMTDDFWLAAFNLACREFPKLEAKRPDYARNTNWIIFRPQGFPARISIDLKGGRGYADLTFQGIIWDVLESTARSLIAPDMLIRPTGKSSAIALKIEPFAVADGLDVIETKIRSGFEACERLVLLYRQHRSVLEPLVRS
ncbi:MAG TPA: hypothetical protein VGO01_24295 [Bradyrhizobium sp.]|jgi:hypothetical protein|nr:hypothetical protein [Bradyrhizobium sp.]